MRCEVFSIYIIWVFWYSIILWISPLSSSFLWNKATDMLSLLRLALGKSFQLILGFTHFYPVVFSPDPSCKAFLSKPPSAWLSGNLFPFIVCISIAALFCMWFVTQPPFSRLLQYAGGMWGSLVCYSLHSVVNQWVSSILMKNHISIVLRQYFAFIKIVHDSLHCVTIGSV